MARLVSLTAAALVLAGCSSEGKVGPPGVDGAQGVVTVLTSGPAGSVTFTPSSATIFYCPTPAYTAGANQAAIISVQLDCAGVPAGAYFSVKAAYNDGATDSTLGWWNWVYNSSVSAQQLGAWSTVYTTLTDGTTYFFELATGNTSTGLCFCDVTAQIIQQ